MAKVEMHVPNKSYDGYYGGVKFSKGVGIFEDVEMAKELAGRYGYEIVEIKEDKPKPAAKEVAEDAEEKKPAPKKRTRKAKAGE
ncbi:hypothetical protein CHCC14819_0438 [Bacillus licheniformis]|uniref:hypothetical protein n=1 Tax=Bacillus licheniformis TaxID=1402 RepID=UPI0011A8B990|nr:hypothetical protein [Bacillus licheniformis]TWM32242.1 hypothetical protein CHCC14819_0438 [Bacillus licheniformis]